jgi:hypothetical protein
MPSLKKLLSTEMEKYKSAIWNDTSVFSEKLSKIYCEANFAFVLKNPYKSYKMTKKVEVNQFLNITFFYIYL